MDVAPLREPIWSEKMLDVMADVAKTVVKTLPSVAAAETALKAVKSITAEKISEAADYAASAVSKATGEMIHSTCFSMAPAEMPLVAKSIGKNCTLLAMTPTLPESK